jgi:hypothetical protein
MTRIGQSSRVGPVPLSCGTFMATSSATAISERQAQLHRSEKGFDAIPPADERKRGTKTTDSDCPDVPYRTAKQVGPPSSRQQYVTTSSTEPDALVVYARVSAACLPNFFKSRSNVSLSVFERTLTAVSIAAACSRKPRVINARPFAVSST